MITTEKIKPNIEYRVVQKGDGYNIFIPQYRKKYLIGYSRWRDCTESKYDGRDGDWYESRFTYDTLEKATNHIEKEIEKQTLIVHTNKNWIIGDE